MNNSLLSITHIVREHIVHIENERMSLSNSFGYHSMMSFHSSIEDEFLIDEFFALHNEDKFLITKAYETYTAVHINSTCGIVATRELN